MESEELRTRLESDLSRVRAEADEKVRDLEKRLEAALGRLIKKILLVPLNKHNIMMHYRAGRPICLLSLDFVMFFHVSCKGLPGQ